jgi:hypothetical protein
MIDVKAYCGKEAGIDSIVDLVEIQSKTLQKEVQKYCDERSVKA